MAVEIQQFIAPILALFCIAATYTDLRSRMIPDWLNYGAVAVAALFAFYTNRLSVQYVAFVILAFAFAYAIYRLGAWAGGDVKFYTGLLAFYPLLAPLPQDALGLFAPLLLVFMASAALLVPILLTVYLPSVYRQRAHLKGAAWDSVIRAAKGAPLATAVGVLVAKFGSPALGLVVGLALLFIANIPIWAAAILAVGAFAWDFNLALPALGFSLLVLAFVTFAQSAFSVLSKHVLRKSIPIAELREGAIPAQTVYLDQSGAAQVWEPPGLGQGVGLVLKTGTVDSLLGPQGEVLVDCLKARGVTQEDISTLQKRGIKELLVKESMPFAPVLALGTAVSILIARFLIA